MQAAACRKFRAEERKAVFAFAHLIDREDVRMIEACYRASFASETHQRFMRISLITQDALYGDDPLGVSLTRAINHAHPAASDLIEDFVIAEVPFRIRHVDFSHYSFKSGSRYPGLHSLAQETTRADSGFDSYGRATLLTFSRALGPARKGIREPVKILHQS